MNLEEQLDDMTVKASDDAATIHTLQAQVYDLEAGMPSVISTLCVYIAPTPEVSGVAHSFFRSLFAHTLIVISYRVLYRYEMFEKEGRICNK